MSFTRLDATRLVVAHAGEAPIIASLGHPAYDLFAAGDRPANFYTWGSMGLASSIGLGLAFFALLERVEAASSPEELATTLAQDGYEVRLTPRVALDWALGKSL